MNIEFLLAEAHMAIERNEAMLSGKCKYRADHHAELLAVCIMLRDEIKQPKDNKHEVKLNFAKPH